MTVKELIEKLSSFDQDSPVLVYNERCEDDYMVVGANEIFGTADDEDGPIWDAPYYCQGYGFARHYFRDNNGKFPVVLLETIR